MISKELLSEVLNIPRLTVLKIQENNLEFELNRDYPVEPESINIYELANMCKEWAILNSEYQLHGSIFKPYEGSVAFAYDVHTRTGGYSQYYIESDTEHEAVFKACQWILEQKDK